MTVTAAAAAQIAGSVVDPELPMVTVSELGILREVAVEGDSVCLTITPTYSGCPAMAEIAADLRHSLAEAGLTDVTIRTQLDPPWSSDDITEQGRQKLLAAGIAPPGLPPAGPIPIRIGTHAASVACPRCHDSRTELVAAFGATACRSLRRCRNCGEPFEQVRAI